MLIEIRHRTRMRALETLLGGAAVLAIAVSLAVGAAGCASNGGTQKAEASNRRTPSLQAASIKLNDDTACCAMSFSNDRFATTDSALDMIMFAYGEQSPLKAAQVLGGPSWMKTDVFNIQEQLPESLSGQIMQPLRGAGGRPLLYPPGDHTMDALKQVYRTLLINLFKLQMKHEMKELPVYELALAKNGPKFGEDKTAGRPCRITDVGPWKGRWLEVDSCGFNTFEAALSASPELRTRVLVDKTGLHELYSFKLHWTPEMPRGMPMHGGAGQTNRSPVPAEHAAPPLFTALREQLGLEVQTTTAPVDTIVIEHIENPVSVN